MTLEGLLTCAAGNALLAGVLALAAAAATRLIRVAVVAHVLWVMVLLRLLIPPLVGIPLLPAEVPTPRAIMSGTSQSSPAVARGVHELAPLPAAVEPSVTRMTGFVPVLAGLWLASAVALLIMVVVRTLRFRRLLAHAEHAPGFVQRRTLRLATKLGIARPPSVRLVQGRVSPMMWALFGSPTILLPSELLPRLRTAELDALLAHELAHLRRRDHWVRGLEGLACLFFWWYPVTWWARRALRAAEELCCDALVLKVLPGSARAYAEGLCKTAECLVDTRGALPAVASGLGDAKNLKWRVTMILDTNACRQSLRISHIVVMLVAVAALVVFPTTAVHTSQGKEVVGDQMSETAGASNVIGDIPVDPAEVDTLPIVLVAAPVDWPEEMRTSGEHGVVVVSAVVNAEGRVGDVEVLRADHPEQGAPEAARAAVRQYSFRPATKDGVQVASRASVTLAYGPPQVAAAEPARIDRVAQPVIENSFVEPRDVDTIPVLQGRTPVEWPDEARASGLRGVVIVAALVNADGGVDDVTLYRADHRRAGIAQAVIDAVRTYRYDPATLHNVGVKSTSSVVVRYDFSD